MCQPIQSITSDWLELDMLGLEAPESASACTNLITPTTKLAFRPAVTLHMDSTHTHKLVGQPKHTKILRIF